MVRARPAMGGHVNATARERLVRHVLRPPLAKELLTLLPQRNRF
jgi:hypothetical protein